MLIRISQTSNQTPFISVIDWFLNNPFQEVKNIDLQICQVLPVGTNQCGLITKSDAERLCSYILTKSPTPPSTDASSPPSTSTAAASSPAVDSPSGACVRVQHNCFGKCVAKLHLSRVQEASGSSQPEPCIGKNFICGPANYFTLVLID